MRSATVSQLCMLTAFVCIPCTAALFCRAKVVYIVNAYKSLSDVLQLKQRLRHAPPSETRVAFADIVVAKMTAYVFV